MDKSYYMPGFRDDGFYVYFVEFDLTERPHVHVEKDGKTAKYWIDRLELFDPDRFKGHELTKMEKILKRRRGYLLELWQADVEKKRKAGRND